MSSIRSISIESLGKTRNRPDKEYRLDLKLKREATRKLSKEAEISPLQYIQQLIEKIARECPKRKGTSDDERRAQMLLARELENQGLHVHEEKFESNDSLAGNLVLHGGMTVLGTLLSWRFPLLGLLCHLLVGFSYIAEATRFRYSLRRLLKWKTSQNIIATAPAETIPKLRIVFMAHADAALTGPMFETNRIKFYSSGWVKKIGLLQHLLYFTVYSQFILAGFDTTRLLFDSFLLWSRYAEWMLTLPSLMSLLGSLHVWIKNEVVPGANDNLTGCAALPVLAARLIDNKPKDVELVFAVTGCEECSLGGAYDLAKKNKNKWDREDSVFIGLDGLSGTRLCFIEKDGPMIPRSIPSWLRAVIEKTAADTPRFAKVQGFVIPMGVTDIGPMLAKGYSGACFACVDPETGVPPDYHLPSDNVSKLDYSSIVFGIDFVEQLTHDIIEFKLSGKK